MPIPLFSTYSQGENRITSSILAVFERILQALCGEPETALLTFGNQPVGPKSVPDGRLRASFAYWLETKVGPNAVRPDQIEGHLKALDADQGVERRRLLVLTPDAKEPPALQARSDERLAWANFDDLVAAIREVTEPALGWLTPDRPLPTEHRTGGPDEVFGQDRCPGRSVAGRRCHGRAPGDAADPAGHAGGD